MKRVDTIVFLGPSLPLREARTLLRADYRPPAKQGDVFLALQARPRCLLLVDGVFESQPSAWHHELLAAEASGTWVFGASSMGALRAAELPGVVTPLGEIAARYADGRWVDDAHVALLHGDADSGFRPLTLPWVNAWATAERARVEGVLTARHARQVEDAAEGLAYPQRTWAAVVRALPWPAPRREAFEAWLRGHKVDLKADDARAALRHVAAFREPRRPARALALSSFVRRHRLVRGNADRLLRWSAEPGAREREADGTRRLLLAAFARQAGIEPDAARVARWRRRLDADGLAPDQLVAAAEALALDELVLEAPERFVSDGPSRVEGLALAARLRGR